MTPTEIINKILEARDLDIKDLALQCGIAPDTLKKAMKRESLSSDIIQKIHDKAGVRKEFLKNGKGEIFTEKPTMGIKSEQADILDSPLVKGFKEQIELLKEIIRMKDDEIKRLNGLQGK